MNKRTLGVNYRRPGTFTADRLAQLVEYRTLPTDREVAGSNRDRTNTNGYKWLDVQVFSDKDYKP